MADFSHQNKTVFKQNRVTDTNSDMNPPVPRLIYISPSSCLLICVLASPCVEAVFAITVTLYTDGKERARATPKPMGLSRRLRSEQSLHN